MLLVLQNSCKCMIIKYNMQIKGCAMCENVVPLIGMRLCCHKHFVITHARMSTFFYIFATVIDVRSRSLAE